MRPLLLLVFTTLCFCYQLSAQCGLTVSAGPDAFYCPGGGSVQLNGTIVGPGLSGFSWSPTAGLSDPGSLSPVATVSGPTSYTLTAEVFDPTTNVIINGDFESGTTGFTTDYIPGTGGAFGTLSDEGQYTIATNSNLTHTNFSNCPDHTGGGNMMVVNGSAIPNENVWCQTVAVMMNTTYAFNAWLQSVHPDNPARLQFSVNGVLLGNDFRASSATCSWREFTETWNSGGTTSAEICITNQNTQPAGNDFAIDDIFFGEVCTQTDEVFLDEVFIDADAVPTAQLACDGSGGVSATLDGGNSSGGPFTFYQWSTPDGNIVSGSTSLFPTVNQPGTYLLSVRYDDGSIFCTDAATVIVSPVTGGFPAANAVVISPINCTTGTGTLGVTGSSMGNDFIYDWSTTDGNIVSGATEAEPTIDQAGTYQLLVTNTVSGCTETATIVMTDNRRDPTVVITPPAVLTCANAAITLDASASDAETNFTPLWTTPDGNIVSGADGLTPTIDQEGTYTLTILDNDNGCTASRSVMVTENKPEPMVNIAIPEVLTCQRTTTRLDGAGSDMGSTIRYTWSTTSGNVVADGNTPQPLVDTAGTYVLTVTDTMTGCERQDSVTVLRTATLPTILLPPPPPFTCGRAQIILDASASSNGNDFAYAWSTSNGGTLSGDTDSLQVLATAVGDYSLRITNTRTGCSRDSTVSVGANTTKPTADAGMSFTLSCSNPLDTLNGRSSSQGPNFTYQWSTNNGNLSGGAQTLRPLISRGGTYQLVVLDTINGCSDTTRVFVSEDNSAPTVAIALPDTLTCSAPMVTLDASSSSSAGGLTLAWTTSDGNFSTGATGLTPQVNEAGTYQLSIFDPRNGCRTTRSVRVVQDTLPPMAVAGPDQLLTCAVRTRQLIAQDPGLGFSFLWSTNDGQFLSTTNTLTPTVNAGGTYFFQVTNAGNGCITSDSVQVLVDQVRPTIAPIPLPGILTCQDTLIAINPGGTAQADYTYSWRMRDGQIAGPDNLPEVTVRLPGTYTLAVRDTTNGCNAVLTWRIGQDTVAPTVRLTPPAILNCAQDAVELFSEGSSLGTEYHYSWQTTDGQLLSDSNATSATAGRPGAYLVTIENTQNGCRNSASVLVQQDTLTPVVLINPPDVLTCTDRVRQLDGRPSSTGPNFQYAWTTTNGNLLNGADQALATVDAAGTYTLTVRNSDNFCSDTAQVVVRANQVFPPVQAGPDQHLTCIDTTASLGADAGAMMGLAYAWRPLSGGGLSQVDQPRTTTREAGIYELLVTDTTTGCNARDSVVVSADQTAPVALILDVPPLNCEVTVRTLMASPTPPGRAYLGSWSTTNGNIVGPDQGLSIVVDQGGSYQLQLVDSANGCSGSTVVDVVQDTLAPSASIRNTPTLNCRITSVDLDGSFSSSGPNFNYQWATSDGSILSGENSLTPRISSAGTYVLTVTNTDNNCTNTDSVSVRQFDQPPVLSASDPETLTCQLTSIQLRARRAGSGEFFLVDWSTEDGNIISGNNSLAPIVDRPGTYLLTVVNQDTDCTAELAVEVSQDIREPILELGEDFDLGCEDLPVSLQADVSGPGPFDYEWSTPDGQVIANGLTARPLIQGPGTYALTVTSKVNGCVATDDITTTQALLLGFEFSQRDPTCRLPLGRVDIDNIDGGTEPFLYNIGGNSFSPAAFADSLRPGRYPLVIQDANGCEVAGEVTVPNVPELDVFIDPSAIITLGESHFINTQTNFSDTSLTQIAWSPVLDLDCADCLRPTASPTASTVYSVLIESSDGCQAQDSVRIIVDILRPIYFPTAFSPNGDGINDAFLPFGNTAQIVRILDFQVFDRWGESVYTNTDFQPNDPAQGWDGRLDGRPMNPAVFVYQALVEFVDGRVVNFKGDVTLIR